MLLWRYHQQERFLARPKHVKVTYTDHSLKFTTRFQKIRSHKLWASKLHSKSLIHKLIFYCVLLLSVPQPFIQANTDIEGQRLNFGSDSRNSVLTITSAVHGVALENNLHTLYGMFAFA